MKTSWPLIWFLLFVAAGCGTSKWTDTGRSATEQLLITDAMDRAVSDLDFRALAGRTTYIDSTAIRKITDSEYLVSCMRQHMLANGCKVMEKREEADYVVEVRAGAVGTDRHDVLYGVPAVNIPSVVPVSGIPSQIPEMPLVKKTDQRAVVKLALFAYNRRTGRPLWQSGAVPEESAAKAVWVLGAGPFQRGSIYDGMEFAGDKLDMPLIDIYRPKQGAVAVADEAFFSDPEGPSETQIAAGDDKSNGDKPSPKAGKPAKQSDVVPAGHAEPRAKTPPVAEKAESAPPGGPATEPPPAGPGADTQANGTSAKEPAELSESAVRSSTPIPQLDNPPVAPAASSAAPDEDPPRCSYNANSIAPRLSSTLERSRANVPAP